MFYFTEEDKDISKSIQRDPLGLQPLWSYFGSKVVENITTVSNDIRGFKLTLLNLIICKEFYDNNVKLEKLNKNKLMRQLILTVESIFIYSTIRQDKNTYGIIGIDNGKKRYNIENCNPVLNPDNPILVNQISLGYFGRYKTPLTRMNVISNEFDVNIEVVKDVKEIIDKTIFEKVKNEIHKILNKSIKNEFKCEFSEFNECENLVLLINTMNQKEQQFWEKKLGLTTNNESTKNTLDVIYDLTKSEMKVEDIIKNAIKIKKEDENLRNILLIEKFFIAIYSVFDMFFIFDNVNDIIKKLEQSDGANMSELNEHINRFKSIKDIEIKDSSNDIKSRFKMLKQCNSSKLTAKDYIMEVYKYHKSVNKYKGRNPWIEINENNLKIKKNNLSYVGSSKSIKNKSFGRDYYISTLRELRKGIRNDAYGKN